MLLALALQAAAPETAVAAERAFNSMAQIEGQWTAFRHFAAPDAVMFNPQPVKAHALLKDARDPKPAVQWWPAQSHVSCDGSAAVNTGPWVRPGGVGYFTTVWVRQPDARMKWIYDAGDRLDKPRPLPEVPRVRRASCTPPRIPVSVRVDPEVKGGRSADSSLRWEWKVAPDGSRWFTAMLWNGRDWDMVVKDEVAARK